MPETATPTQADPKQTAGNIAQGIKDRASGKATGNRAVSKGPEVPPDGDEKAPVQAADPNAGKTKYSVGGKEYWLTPKQEKAYAQKGIAFEPRVSELDRLKKEVATFEQALLNNPGAIIANVAARAKVPLQDMVKQILSSNASDEVKEATGRWYWENVAMRQRMDPKDRQILEQTERIKALEASDKQKADMAIANENRQRVVRALGEISGQIQETLKDLGLETNASPAAIRIAKEIADVMRVSYFARKPCTAKQAAEKVKARIIEYQRHFYDALDMDKLVDTLGKENAEKVRKHFLKAVKEGEKNEQQASRPNTPSKRDERKTMNMDDFHDYLDELKKTGK